jgi:hypothetical protein
MEPYMIAFKVVILHKESEKSEDQNRILQEAKRRKMADSSLYTNHKSIGRG